MKDKLRACLPGAKATLLGVAGALAGVLLLSLLSAALLTAGISNRFLPFFAHLTVLGGAALGGFLAGFKEKSRGLLAELFTGLALFVLHLLLTLCFGSPSLSLITFGLAEGLGGTLGGILGVNLRKN